MKAIAPFLLAASLMAQQAVQAPGGVPTQTTSYTAAEVGIDEKLGGTVNLDAVLRDEEGRPVTLRSLIHKPTVLTLNYFRCAGICTPLLNGVVEVLGGIKLQPGKDFQVITVSFDARDTSEIALNKRTNYLKQIPRPLEPTAWRFLTGEAAASKAVCDSVGFRFKAEGDDFVHAGAIMILSPEGKITRYMYGTSYLPADLEMAVNEAARGETRPTITKWLNICFNQETPGRKQVLSITKVAGWVLILGAITFLVVLGARRKSTPPPEEEA